ncbi:helix-turn-helix domain-containing protein [Stappia sp. BW2]|uniref:helix-turn-helix domain-containing protein n=1 Tax=Stappia sp. BW2 TaxID=2592622 RepID=UPI0011DEAED7|nr:helix-turn-helix domain-containing protein [Stappia sp. BW2]TYC80135.1 helix-turn-helix domain-containing protein [Stappia sp. BW2]
MSQQEVMSDPGGFSAATPVSIECARDRLVEVCGNFEILPHAKSDHITGAIDSRIFGQFNAAVVATRVSSVWRDERMIRNDPARNLFLIYQQSGHSVIRQGDTESLMQPGSFHLVDSAFPSQFRYADETTRKISVHLPREETVRRLGQTCIGGVAIDRSDPLNVALEAVLVKLLSAGADTAGRLSDTLVELLGTYLRCRETQTPSLETEEMARLRQARDLIELKARDPNYCLESLCRDLGMSRRSVQRIFSKVNETPSRAIQEVRLAWAHRQLSSDPQRTVADIAFASGFNDLSHFHKSFRTRYGDAPGAIRKKAGSTA